MRFKAAQAKSEGDQSAIKEIWVSKMAHHGWMVNKWYVSINKKNKKKKGHNINFVEYIVPFHSYMYIILFWLNFMLRFVITCRVTNRSPNPNGIGYRPNKPNTINL